MLEHVTRIDVVWDTYKADSLKANTRQNRGTGSQLRVAGATAIPPDWKSFLRANANKEGLYKLLACAIEAYVPPEGKLVVSTCGDRAVSSPRSYMSALYSTHEEADTRMLLHAGHCYREGLTKIMIHATDTDVVVLAVATVTSFPGCQIWIAFGHGSKLRYIPAHSIAENLNKVSSWGLLFLHAFSGCDVVSAFCGIGKKTAWAVWRSMPNLHPLFYRLSRAPSDVSDQDMDELQRFVVVMYQRTSGLTKVNDARKHMFAYGNRQIQNIPPSLDALQLHVKRAVFQAGHVWGQTLVARPHIPSPSDWGWTKVDQTWIPKWSCLPKASKGCLELLKCGCKTNCQKRCKCKKANLSCTQLCFCAGQCNQNTT